MTAVTDTPHTDKPKTAKSKTAKPKPAKSKTGKPKAAKPKAAKPKAATSKTAKPQGDTPQPGAQSTHTVTKRELNQNTAAVLDMVSQGADVVITERGKPRWRIVFDENPPMSYIERLEMLGLITPPNPNPAPWPDKSDLPFKTEEEMEALIEEMKGDH